jgi:hypothetical protein
MNDQPDLKFRKTLEDIRLHFGFLFKRGYRLSSVLFAGQTNDDWQVTLSEGNRLVHLYSEQGIVNLIMSTLLQANEVVYFDMEASSNLEFFYTLDEFPIAESQQLQKIARFLEKNLIALLAQAEKDNLPSIEPPMSKFAAQQKRTII